MSQSWPERHEQLLRALDIAKGGDEDDRLGLALDEGKAKTHVARLKFSDRDLRVIGALDAGQYSTIDVVKCRLNNALYVRKSIDKATARRCYQQCFPQTERDILLLAHRTCSHFIPHLIAAYQSPDVLYLLMPYGSGGTLWDVLEYSGGSVSEPDLQWWIPQAVSAISWCHEQGFCHRDIKPHNFVITPSSHILLIDFGSAAPLLPPVSATDKRRLVPRQYCRAPCGTCDYIAPEVLTHFEEDMINFEAGESSAEQSRLGQEDIASSTVVSQPSKTSDGCYGMEVDWWSLGVLIYELYYGLAPFFAEEVKRTYERIVHHEIYLKFDKGKLISPELKGFVKALLQDKEMRIGRNGVKEIKEQSLLQNVQWSKLHLLEPPASLQLPQFAYTDVAQEGLMRSVGHSRAPSLDPDYVSQSHSRPFNFSQFFRSSAGTKSGTPGGSRREHAPQDTVERQGLAEFIGYSWGPPASAFSEEKDTPNAQGIEPSDFRRTHIPRLSHSYDQPPEQLPFFTPLRPNPQIIPQTFPRNGTVPRTVGRRGITDREAMDALLEHIGMSAQKKVMESGRKPRSMGRLAFQRTLGTGANTKHRPIPLNLRFQLDENDSRRISSIRERGYGTEDDDTTGSSALPSPSPTPRPSSALSSTLTLTRRSLTPIMNHMTTTDGHLTARNITPTPIINESGFIKSRAQEESARTLRRVASESVVYEASPATRYRERGVSYDERGLSIMDNRLAHLQHQLDQIGRKLDSIQFDHNGRLRRTH